ncbi:MAG TPA: GcrA family cell cycle regulator [Acetobacteraceae bacterium]|jgi:GcrA cell cycle regulator|nr:GcrA family cell cycle regulator [Acetobacteraceae bacterium]
MEWAEETITRLRELWSEGHSTAEIGRRLGVSKNAVVGKAHRLDLPARPSPIRREGERPPQRSGSPRRLAGPTLPPLSSATLGGTALSTGLSATAGSLSPQPLVALPPRPPAPVAPRPAPAPSRTALAAAPPRPYGRVITCCWPIGEPGTRSFRFCDAESVPGKPYCEEHAQKAYVKLKDRREDAA